VLPSYIFSKVLFLILLFFCAVSKGISANMLKTTSKRRRTQREIKEEKEYKLQKELEEQVKDDEIHALQQ